MCWRPPAAKRPAAPVLRVTPDAAPVNNGDTFVFRGKRPMSSTGPAVQRPSKTAELAAAVRALHLRRARSPVFNDDLALEMCGPFWRTVVSSRLLSWLVVDGILRRLAPISPAVYTRARFGEDCLEAAIGRGVEQYVIVGAGYETFAMRRQDLMARLTVLRTGSAGNAGIEAAAYAEGGKSRCRKDCATSLPT